jgi:hypothetical protein
MPKAIQLCHPGKVTNPNMTVKIANVIATTKRIRAGMVD